MIETVIFPDLSCLIGILLLLFAINIYNAIDISRIETAIDKIENRDQTGYDVVAEFGEWKIIQPHQSDIKTETMSRNEMKFIKSRKFKK